MPKGRQADKDRDVYGAFVSQTMNSIRAALKAQWGMSDAEVEIVEAVRDTLLARDPSAVGVAQARVRTY